MTRILEGAGTRNDTTRGAIAALGTDECNAGLIRALINPSQTIIAASVDALNDYCAVDTAIASADTIVQVDAKGASIADLLPRSNLRRGKMLQLVSIVHDPRGL